MDLELRTITEDEYERWVTDIGRAFGGDHTEEELEAWRAVSELDRNIAAFDRGDMVGTAGAFSFDMALPGGATIAAAGVTAVSVRPTHRRRGVLRHLMARQLADVADRSEAVAVLTASETPIYGRFGYGLASELWDWTVETEGLVLASPSAASGSVRLVETEDARATLPGLRERAWRRHPGEVAWSDARWDHWLRDPKDERDGGSARRFAVHESSAGVGDGYVAWRHKPAWKDGLPDGTLDLHHLYGEDAEVEAALFEFLLSIDLIRRIHAPDRPVDDPFRWRLADHRRMKVHRVADLLWVRLLDIERALSARQLGADDRLVIEVADRFRPQTAGTYAVEPGSCRRSPDGSEPDLRLDVADLGALYLGGVRATTLALAGRVHGDAGALQRADRLFRVAGHPVVLDPLLMEPAMEEIVDGTTTWRFDRSFLSSNWTCIWGRGCLGILDEPAEHLGQGCCSIGAELDGIDEARMISALAATLDPDRFQHRDQAAREGIFADEDRNATRVVDGACIFLNRPGFQGGSGCALHLAALDSGESPRDWKPSVCWQLPLRVDWVAGDGGTEVATVRRWTRDDWGDDGETMAWCCTEGERAYVGDRPVIESLAAELEAVVGTPVYVELRRRLTR